MKGTAIFAVGLSAGVLLLGGLRFALLEPPPATHFHANWALFMDGERVDLSGDRFMEDVGACAADPDLIRPQDRAHMHENNHDVVHVHHKGVTWGHFLANLGFAVGEDWLRTPDGRLLESDSTATLRFVLNGRPEIAIHDRLIRSQDRLLVSYGDASREEVVNEQFSAVASTAGEFNEKADPASCMGHGELTTGERLRRAFWQ